jgi:2-polyprenyl-6-hydroxyphenyl methylase/3-demethylubiquinone-9 3-methyltransferase
MGHQQNQAASVMARESRSSGPETDSGGVRTIAVSSTKDIAAFFDRYASRNVLELHGGKRLLRRQLALIHRFARPRRSDRVLDLGCGTGDHLLALRAEIAQGIGIDLSPKMVETAGARARQAAPDAHHLAFRVDDAQSTSSIPSNSTDLVICIGALEHMVDKRAAIRNAYRVLRRGGRFFLLGPDPGFVWYTTIAPWLGFRTRHLSTDRFCSAVLLAALLEEAGFCEIERFSWSFVPTGDLPFLMGVLLESITAVGEWLGLDSLRGGLGVCAWRGEANAH